MERGYLRSGLSYTGAWTEIGEEYGLCWKTVQYHLHEDVRKRERAGDHARDRGPRSSYRRALREAERRRQGYARAGRAIGLLLAAAYDRDDTMSSRKLVERLYEVFRSPAYRDAVSKALDGLGLARVPGGLCRKPALR